MGQAEIAAFLTHLASERNFAAPTHRKAPSALLFFLSRGLGVELLWTMEIGRPKTTQRLPEVLAVSEVMRTLSLMHGACDVGQTALRHRDDALLARMEAMEAERIAGAAQNICGYSFFHATTSGRSLQLDFMAY